MTSRWPGAYYNAWTAAYTSATVTLTLVKGSRTVTYSAGSGGTRHSCRPPPASTLT